MNDKQVKIIAKAEINKALKLFRPSYFKQHVDVVCGGQVISDTTIGSRSAIFCS